VWNFVVGFFAVIGVAATVAAVALVGFVLWFSRSQVAPRVYPIDYESNIFPEPGDEVDDGYSSQAADQADDYGTQPIDRANPEGGVL
jgi:hypothetical protein